MPNVVIVLHCKSEFVWYLVFKSFYFLEADDVWIFLFYKVQKAFLEDGSDAVDISGGDFHSRDRAIELKDQFFLIDMIFLLNSFESEHHKEYVSSNFLDKRIGIFDDIILMKFLHMSFSSIVCGIVVIEVTI